MPYRRTPSTGGSGASSGAASLTPTAVKTAAYTAAVGDLAMMNVAAGATALTLPAAPADKAQVGYRAIGATTATPLVVTAGAGDTIGTAGATTASVPLADEVTVLQYQAASTRWLAVANVKTQASLDSRFMYGLAIGRGTCVVPVGVRTHVGFDNTDATMTSITFRQFHPIADPNVTDILPVFTNGQSLNGVGGDVEVGNPIQVAASIETSDGVLVPLTFNGQRVVTIERNAHVVADVPVSFGAQVTTTDKFAATIALGGVWIRTWVAPTTATRSEAATTTSGSSTVGCAGILAADTGKQVTGTGIPASSYVGAVTPGTSFVLMSGSTGAAVNATATGSPTLSVRSVVPLNLGSYANTDNLTAVGAGDLTTVGSAAVGGGSGTSFYGPSLILARSRARKPIVGLLSDSIFDGYQDDFHSPYFGPVARACVNLGLPFVKASKGGEAAGQIATPKFRRNRAALLDGCTHVLVELGTNDQALTTGAGAGGVTSLTATFVAIGNWLVSLGIKPYLTTIPPRTTSTDAWATTTNQTPTSGSQITYLAQMNQAIRAGLSPYLGYVDLEGLCSSAQDSGKWAPGATLDGVHPSDTLSRGTITTAVQALLATWSL